MTLTARTPYDANGRATVFAGELVALELSIESRNTASGAFEAEDLSERLFYQRVLGRKGEILAEAQVSFVEGDDGRVIRFVLDGAVTAGLIGERRAYVDLNHVIAEQLDGGRDYLFEPLPFSVRLADDPAVAPSGPGAPSEAAPIARFIVRRDGGKDRLVVRNAGSRGPPGPQGTDIDPGDLTLIFNNKLI